MFGWSKDMTGAMWSVITRCVVVCLRNEQQRIHPDNQEHVRVVREQLQSEQVCAVCSVYESLASRTA